MKDQAERLRQMVNKFHNKPIKEQSPLNTSKSKIFAI